MIVPTSEFWDKFKSTEGALGCCESLAIINIAYDAPEGRYVELGTHKGKSAFSAMQGLKSGVFYAVDPIFEDRELAQKVGREIASIAANKPMYVHVINDYSTNFIPEYQDYAYVFIDSGSHGDGLPMEEVQLIEDRVIKGGIVAFHDYKNQFTEVEQAYNYLISTGKYEEIPINWKEIISYVKRHNLEEGNDSWHLYPELPHPPNFVGALKRK